MGTRVVFVSDEETFDREVASNETVLVYFTAKWCGPCRSIAPYVSVLANDYPSTRFLKVDVDELRSVANRYEVAAMPTFFLVKNGVIQSTVKGANSGELKRMIAAAHGTVV